MANKTLFSPSSDDGTSYMANKTLFSPSSDDGTGYMARICLNSSGLLDVGRFFVFSAAEKKQLVNDCGFYLTVATRENIICHEGRKQGQVASS